jgi:DmsE family decaheme c-type cytochrome
MILRPISAGRAAALAAVLLFPLWLNAQNEPPGYAGSEACGVCHEDIYKAFQQSPHAILETEKKRGWETRSCEACHGPGAKHAETADASFILNPAKMAPMRADQDCLKCHLEEPTQIGRIQGSHARNQVSCVTCHSMHKPDQPLVVRNRTAINKKCAGCHTSEWAAFQRPYTHRLPQGAMSCVDCHNPHGSFLPKNIRTVSANEPGCFRCHGDKRGPFTFEHAPVRLEGCMACHEAHGSANPRMLKRQEVRFLCLECHANILTLQGATTTGALGGIPPALHDMRSPRFRNCTVCHIKIHGSYVNRDFFR